MDNLLYRNQFVLGPSFIDRLESWNRINVTNSICLTIHPALNFAKVTHENKSLILLGFILDPYNTEESDVGILNDLMNKFTDFENLLFNTYRFGGRWILVINDGMKTKLIHDAAGLRQIYYSDTTITKNLWCASQPGILAEVLRLEMDVEAMEFIRSFSAINKEYWWPGDSSPYKEIKHLIPNHFLDLSTGQSSRYWPDKNIDRISLHEGVDRTSWILSRMMKSASNRYDLTIAMTAGWDSRLVLASAKEIRNKISCFTTKQAYMSDDFPDLTIPSLLLSRLGIKHEILKHTEPMDGEFMTIFKKNIPFAHDIWAPDARLEFESNYQKKVAVTGSASEVARDRFLPMTLPKNKSKVSGRDISLICGMGDDVFQNRFFDEWLTGLLPHLYNHDLESLLYWEQRAGNWIATCSLEFDIAWKDIFTPYNCRELLINMLSVHVRHRNSPKFRLYSRTIRNLWPEILDVPINPHRKTNIYARTIDHVKDIIPKYVPSPIKHVIKKVAI